MARCRGVHPLSSTTNRSQRGLGRVTDKEEIKRHITKMMNRKSPGLQASTPYWMSLLLARARPTRVHIAAWKPRRSRVEAPIIFLSPFLFPPFLFPRKSVDQKQIKNKWRQCWRGEILLRLSKNRFHAVFHGTTTLIAPRKFPSFPRFQDCPQHTFLSQQHPNTISTDNQSTSTSDPPAKQSLFRCPNDHRVCACTCTCEFPLRHFIVVLTAHQSQLLHRSISLEKIIN